MTRYQPMNISVRPSEGTYTEASRALARGPAFFADRLKVLLRDQGKRHDLVDAVFALGDDDLVRIVARVEALDGFLTTDDGANLLAGYKRATNILKAEEKKGAAADRPGRAHADAPREETALIDALADMALPTSRRAGAAKTSPPPCAPWRTCARRWTPFSTRC